VIAVRTVVLATANPGKQAEFARLLGDENLRLTIWGAEVEEVGKSYAENAKLKAEAALAATGTPSLGDDSGLEVTALDGYPGLYSARIGASDAQRIALVHQRLREAGATRPWRATFVCALALAAPDRETELFEGRCGGAIVEVGRGTEGFGYDPIFELPELGRTMAELGPSGKDRYGHRALAVRELLGSGALRSLPSRRPAV